MSITTEAPNVTSRKRTADDTRYRAWVARAPREPMVLESVDLGPLGAEEVEVAVESCGVCHSDVSVFNNDWGISRYPAILGHEVIGRVTAVGPNTKGIKVGQRVGVGWNSGSCMHCRQCMSGSHNLCPEVEMTIVGHRGGFASHIRSHWAWTLPLPENLNAADAGPLLCGGVTVFAPIAMYSKPAQRVGIIGIGGAGAYGCEVRRGLRLPRDGAYLEREQVRGGENSGCARSCVDHGCGGNQEAGG
jgi:uncharacterized zinc-type alcohol dehydrogenase-like protein